jgi:hypothetical protein
MGVVLVTALLALAVACDRPTRQERRPRAPGPTTRTVRPEPDAATATTASGEPVSVVGCELGRPRVVTQGSMVALTGPAVAPGAVVYRFSGAQAEDSFLQRLGDDGDLRGEPVELPMRAGHQRSVARLGDGHLVTGTTTSLEAVVTAVGADGAVRVLCRAGEDVYFAGPLAASGDAALLAWTGYSDDLFVTRLDLARSSPLPPVRAAAHVVLTPIAAASDGGFLLAWSTSAPGLEEAKWAAIAGSRRTVELSHAGLAPDPAARTTRPVGFLRLADGERLVYYHFERGALAASLRLDRGPERPAQVLARVPAGEAAEVARLGRGGIVVYATEGMIHLLRLDGEGSVRSGEIPVDARFIPRIAVAAEGGRLWLAWLADRGAAAGAILVRTGRCG